MASQNNIHVPDELLAELQSKAAGEGKSVDELVAEALRLALEERSWQNLLEYGRQKGREHSFREEDAGEIVHNWRNR